MRREVRILAPVGLALLFCGCDRGQYVDFDSPPYPYPSEWSNEVPQQDHAETASLALPEQVLLACTAAGPALEPRRGQDFVGAGYLTMDCGDGQPSSVAFPAGPFRLREIDGGLRLVRQQGYALDVVASLNIGPPVGVLIENSEALFDYLDGWPPTEAPPRHPTTHYYWTGGPDPRFQLNPAWDGRPPELDWRIDARHPGVAGACLRAEVRGQLNCRAPGEWSVLDSYADLYEGQVCTISGVLLLSPAERLSPSTLGDTAVDPTGQRDPAGPASDSGPAEEQTGADDGESSEPGPTPAGNDTQQDGNTSCGCGE